MAEFIGSSGTLVGAALETAGYFYQSWILDALGAPGINAIGALLYSVGAVIAIVTFVVSGNFRLGAWFLLGPGLFFGMIIPRQETSGADWQFGGEPRDRQKLEQAVGEFYYQNPYTPKISSFFAAYNDLVSSTVRDIVATLNNQRERVDLKFTFRSQLYSYMISPTLKEPGFRELLHLSLLGKCQDQIEAGREMADPKNGQSVREEWARKYGEIRDKTRIEVSALALTYLSGLKVDYPNAFSNVYVTNPDEEIANFYSNCHQNPGQNCIGAPSDIGSAVQHIQSQQQGWASTYGQGGFDPDSPGSAAAKAALAARAAQIDAARQELSGKTFTCHQVWNFVFVGLHDYAYRTMQEATRAGQQRGLTADDLRKMFTEMFANGNEQDIYKSIARRLFTTEANMRSTSSLIADYAQKGRMIDEFAVPAESPLVATERARTGNRTWQERTKVFASAASLPYYQGLGLYFLAVAYPFFAFLLLVPGKHAGFLLWFMLWIWLKSWDIGFAVVMLLDDALYSLFVGNMQALSDPRAHQLDADLSVAVLALRQADPTFNLATYYSIIGVALHSIPMISSYLVIGSAAGGAGLIAAGMSRFTGADGGSFGSGGGLAQAARMGQSQFGIDAARGQALQLNYGRAQEYARQAKNSSGGIGINGQGEAAGNSAVMSGYTNEGIGNRKSNTLGMTGQEMTGAAETASTIAGVAKGSKTSIAGKLNPKNYISRSRAKRNQMIDAVADGVASVGDEVSSQLLKLAGDRYSIADAWSSYDGMNSSEVQALAAVGRNYDMFEIPWTDKTGGWDAEWQQAADEWRAKFAIAATSAKAMGSIMEAAFTKPDTLKPRATINKIDNIIGEQLTQVGVGLGLAGLTAVTDSVSGLFKEDPVPHVPQPSNLNTRAIIENSPAQSSFGGASGGASYRPGGPTVNYSGPAVGTWEPGAPGGGTPDAKPGDPSVSYGYPQTHYGYPNYERGGDPAFGRGLDPAYGRGIERIHPHAVDALSEHEARLGGKYVDGRMANGRDTNTRLAYGDPSVQATEAQLDAAHERLESTVAELRAKGVTGPELEEAERLLQGFHSSEGSYDAMTSRVVRAESRTARDSKTPTEDL